MKGIATSRQIKTIVNRMVVFSLVSLCACSNDDDLEKTTRKTFEPTDSENLIAYYKFDNDLLDSSTNLLNGTATTPSYTQDRDGNSASAYQLTGMVDQTIRTSDIPLEAGSFSIVFWMFVDSEDLANDATGFARYVLGSRDICNDSKFFNFLYAKNPSNPSIGSTLGFEVRNGTGVGTGIGAMVDGFPEDQWVHVAVTVDDVNKKTGFYINGEVKGESSWDGEDADVSNTAPFEMGDNVCIGVGNNGRMIATIDEVALFASVLNSVEIGDLVNY